MYAPDATRKLDSFWDYALGASIVVGLFLAGAALLRFECRTAVRGLVLLIVWIATTGWLWDSLKSEYFEHLARTIESATNDFAPLGGKVTWSRGRLCVFAIGQNVGDNELRAWIPLLQAHSIQVVDLSRSSVTEVALRQFAYLSNVNELHLRKGVFTQSFLNELRQRLPSCDVIEIDEPGDGNETTGHSARI